MEENSSAFDTDVSKRMRHIVETPEFVQSNNIRYIAVLILSAKNGVA